MRSRLSNEPLLEHRDSPGDSVPGEVLEVLAFPFRDPVIQDACPEKREVDLVLQLAD
jgi:hypothetical protein